MHYCWRRISLLYANGREVKAQSASHIFVVGGGPTLIDVEFYSSDEPYGTFVQQSSDFMLALNDLLIEIDPEFSFAPNWEQEIGTLTCGADFGFFSYAYAEE